MPRTGQAVKLGADQADAGAEDLLEIKELIEVGPKGKSSAVLCILCGATDAAYQRPDGAFVAPVLRGI